MDLEYPELGVVIISMIKHLQKVLGGFPEELKGTYVTQAEDQLFQVRGS